MSFSSMVFLATVVIVMVKCCHSHAFIIQYKKVLPSAPLTCVVGAYNTTLLILFYIHSVQQTLWIGRIRY